MKNVFLLVSGTALVASICGTSLLPARPQAATSAAAIPTREKIQKDYVLVPIPYSAIHHAQTAEPHIRLWESTSANWSGYASQTSPTSPQAGSVTDVSGSWIVPAVTGSKGSTKYSSIWVGIDGYSNGTVEQLGTEQDWTGKAQSNYAWIEMYPAGAFLIKGFVVNAGDQISAEVHYSGNNAFQLTIYNNTRNEPFTVTKSTTSASRTSAEWIVEAPSTGHNVLPLASFGTAFLFNCQATINGVAGPIDAAAFFDPLTMVDPKGGKATPSGLSDSPSGSGFTVTYSP